MSGSSRGKSIPKYVIKRDGRTVLFDRYRIKNAIYRSVRATGYDIRDSENISKRLTDKVIQILSERFKNSTPSVEDIQDVIVSVLRKEYPDVAREYKRYREWRTKTRELRSYLGPTQIKFDVNGIIVLKERYLLKDGQGNVIETPEQMFMRVSRHVSKAEDPSLRETYFRLFYEMMVNLDFLPNSPTLMNAGTRLGQLSACFVLPVHDSLRDIFESVKNQALIQQSGGGTGFSFSELRPEGDIVKSTNGRASGPVSFMRVFDITSDVIKQGGRRRGANMGVLNVNHPDILKFIRAKEGGGLSNFNISVGLTDEFMDLVDDDGIVQLINPRDNSVWGEVSAKHLFRMIARSAWSTGDPGVLFLDEINRHNPVPHLGRITATNPCGEQPLLPYESCNLGSINLSNFVSNKRIDYQRLERVVRLAIRFLDDVITVNRFPLTRIRKQTLLTRKIGLGVMGFADMLVKLEVPYDSERGLRVADRVMSFIQKIAKDESSRLGEERGNFPAYEDSVYHEKGIPMRNATVTTIAPTGSISMIAGCSSGIEPIFSLAYYKNVLDGKRLLYINKQFMIKTREEGIQRSDILNKVIRSGGRVSDIEEVPDHLKRIFKTALEISPEYHVRMQAVFQKHVDNAVSKTVNLPKTATVEDVERIFKLAYKLRCKGITVYRQGSKKNQVLSPVAHKTHCSRCGATFDSVGTCVRCPYCGSYTCD